MTTNDRPLEPTDFGFSLPDILDIDPSTPDGAAALDNAVAGSYEVGWEMLRRAAASCAMQVVITTSTALDAVRRIAEKNDHPGEAALMTTINYTTMLLGPCLAGVLVPAFALESFLRFGFQAALEGRRTGDDRRGGISEPMHEEIVQFGSLPVVGAGRKPDKLAGLAAALGCAPPPANDEVRLAARDLVMYRNDCVHDTPVLKARAGRRDKARPAHQRRYPVAESFGPYEPLAGGRRPARPIHVAHAIAAHDAVVRHFLSAMEGSPWADAVRAAAGGWRGGSTIAGAMGPTPNWDALGRMANAWETHAERVGTPPEGAIRDLALSLRRRVRLRALESAGRPGAPDGPSDVPHA